MSWPLFALIGRELTSMAAPWGTQIWSKKYLCCILIEQPYKTCKQKYLHIFRPTCVFVSCLFKAAILRIWFILRIWSTTLQRLGGGGEDFFYCLKIFLNLMVIYSCQHNEHQLFSLAVIVSFCVRIWLPILCKCTEACSSYSAFHLPC